MADPKRLVMLQALTAYLAGEIVPANGYQHDLTDVVFRGRGFFDKDDPAPMIAILDNPDPDRYPAQAGMRGWETTTNAEDYVLLLQGWGVDDKINPTDPAHRLMADVRKALAKLAYRGNPGTFEPPAPNFHLGGLIDGLLIEAGVVRPPEQPSELAFFWMRVVVKYTEDPNDPYNLN